MKRLFFALALFSCLPSICHADELQSRKDIMDQAFITPTRVVWTKGNVSDQEVLLKPGTGQSHMAGDSCCNLEWTSDTTSIILDYGKELHGGLKLVVGQCGRTPKLVRIRFGESVAETCSEVCDSEWIARHSTDDHAMRDLTLKIPRDGSIEIGNTGFRFVRIDLLERDATLALREATAILRWRDIPYEGDFRCSDERLNAIWQTGAWTTHLNMQEYIWDGIKRDRLIWLGDMHPEMSTVAAVFGYNDVIDRSIDLACKQYPVPQWLNGMSAYSMWYLIILYDWYMQNGKIDYLKQHRDYIKGVIDEMDAHIHEDGSEDLAEMRFLDWPSSPYAEGVEAGYRALLSMALEKGAKLCELIDEPEQAAKSLAARARLNTVIKQHHGLKQAAALMALANLMPEKQACDEVLKADGAKGFSTFYGYYMLEALAKAGEYQLAIDIIREFWGGMLDMGATTFWEDFNLDWTQNAFRIDEMPVPGKADIHGDFGDYCYKSFRHSLCHGWASGPTPWLSHHVLGVRILEPGCRKVAIDPHLGDLTWAEGRYPTPYGNITIRVDYDRKGRIVAHVSKPAKVKMVRTRGVRIRKYRS